MRAASNHHRTTPCSLQAFVDTIEAHIARNQLSRCAFGRAALGDASFLGRGSDVRLCTADKVLAYMNLEQVGPRFLRRVGAFLKVTGIKPRVLGEGAMGDPGFVLRLRKGRSPTLGTMDKVNDWMAAKASPAELEAVRSAVEDGSPAVPPDAAAHEESEMEENARYMTTPQVAAYLGLSPRTLESYRTRGMGPMFYVFGNLVRYLLSDVVKWAAERRRHSTSDDGLRGAPSEDGDEERDGDEETVDDDCPGKSGR